MNSLRRWLYRPKRTDSSLLAQFYFADEDLNQVAAELDSFEGRKDPERCTALVNQLRSCQARVLNVVAQMMDEQIKESRACRDFRVKFPDDVIQENLAGQLWFGAECLAAGSSIMNREIESACMRPLARALTKNLDSLRNVLREQCLRNVQEYTDSIKESLIIFDKLFAEFELSYVSAMVPVKTAHEYDLVQEITVLFSETVQRALKVGLLTADMIDEYDPALMFTIPRLAIVSGVHVFKDGPLNPDNDPWNLSEMFRPFQTLLLKIRELLAILTEEELNTLERALCSQEEPSFLISLERDISAHKNREDRAFKDILKLKNAKDKEESDDGSVESELTAREIAERLEALANNFETSRIAKLTKSNESLDQKLEHRSSDLSTDSSSSSFLSEGEDEISEAADKRVDPVNGRSQNDKVLEVASDSERQLAVIEQNVPSPSADSQDQMNLSHHRSSSGSESSQTEGAAVGRANFALNKCDSTDSGLHSEVLSNSGSTYTISSSDSQQHVASPCDGPATSSGQHQPDLLQDSGHSGAADTQPGAADTQPGAGGKDETSSDPLSDLCLNFDIDCCSDDGASSGSHCLPGGAVAGELAPGSPELAELGPDTLPQGSISEHLNIGGSDLTRARSSVSSGDSFTTQSAEESSHCKTCPGATLLGGLSADGQSQDPQEISAETCNTCSQVHSHSSPVLSCRDNQLQSSLCADICSQADSSDLHITGDHHITGVTCSTVSGCSPSLSSQPNSVILAQSLPGSATSGNIHFNQTSTSSEASSDTVAAQVSSEYKKEDSLPSSSQHRDLSSLFSSSVHYSQPEATASLPSSQNTDLTNVIVISAPYRGPSNTSSSSPLSHQDGPSSAVPNSSSETSLTTHNRSVRTSDKSTSTKRSYRKKRRQQETSSSHGQKLGLPRQAQALMEIQLLDHECNHSSETSSYTSDCRDQEEIDLAVKAAENATRQQVRARFQSSSDMIHRLFVCISGVADQLQTNFAGDLRNILRAVFDMNCSQPVDVNMDDKCKDTTPLEAAYRSVSQAARTSRRTRSTFSQKPEPPVWIPDEQILECMSCQVPFTFVRRRHHCRNCGKIFCSRCSSNFVPLPHFGQDKAVRVCNRCFMFHVTPFTLRQSAQ